MPAMTVVGLEGAVRKKGSRGVVGIAGDRAAGTCAQGHRVATSTSSVDSVWEPTMLALQRENNWKVKVLGKSWGVAYASTPNSRNGKRQSPATG